MPLYTQSIKNLKGGISQQPDILRFQDQGEEQVNAWSSESGGLQKRPPSVFKKRISTVAGIPDNSKFHLVNRDEQEQYYLVFTGATVRAFTLDGVEVTVSGSTSYLSTSKPQEDIRVVTVADYTFIVNRSKVVTAGTSTAYPGYNLKSRGLINVRGGQYGRKLTVSINGGPEVNHELPNGNSAEEDPPRIDAQFIAISLRNLLRTAYPDYTFDEGSGYIVCTAPAGGSINRIDTKDGYANQIINPILTSVQTVSKLPLAAPDGYIIKVQGETNSSDDEYYVRYDADAKTWRETVEPGTVLGFNKDTMPHALIRQGDGTFKFDVLNWSERGAGNEDTNPMPSFVDAKINDVFFYRNRLGFLSGENVIMSRPADYFAFFPKSVATLSDGDPIDVAVSHPRISVLKYAVPFSEQLLLWSDEVQFVMSSAGVLTAKSIQLDVGSEFAVSDNARPFTVGRSVFFSSPRGTFTSINRYFAVADVSDVKDADDTTGHVLSYIPNVVFDIQGSSTENFICVSTSGARNKLFIYKFLFKDGVQLQASWSHWDFGEGSKVLASACIGSTMYLVRKNADGVDLESISFTKDSTDFPAEALRLHVDGKVLYTIPTDAYDADSYTTTLNMATAYGVTPSAGQYAVIETNGRYEELPEQDFDVNPEVILTGDWSGKTIVIGRRYTMRYVFSRFLIKQEDQNGTQTVDSGRLQLRRAWVNYEDTGAVTFTVSNPNRDFTSQLNGGDVGSLILGGVNVGDGQYRFPMNGNALTTRLILESSYPTPVSIVGCGWEASYARKARNI